MNRTSQIILLLLFLSQVSIAQDSVKVVNDAWIKLKTEMQRRDQIVLNLTNTLGQSKHVHQKELNDIAIISANLIRYMDTLENFNRFSILHAYTLNIHLSQ